MDKERLCFPICVGARHNPCLEITSEDRTLIAGGYLWRGRLASVSLLSLQLLALLIHPLQVLLHL
jgi:hypothetical protein